MTRRWPCLNRNESQLRIWWWIEMNQVRLAWGCRWHRDARFSSITNMTIRDEWWRPDFLSALWVRISWSSAGLLFPFFFWSISCSFFLGLYGWSLTDVNRGGFKHETWAEEQVCSGWLYAIQHWRSFRLLWTTVRLILQLPKHRETLRGDFCGFGHGEVGELDLICLVFPDLYGLLFVFASFFFVTKS